MSFEFSVSSLEENYLVLFPVPGSLEGQLQKQECDKYIIAKSYELIRATRYTQLSDG